MKRVYELKKIFDKIIILTDLQKIEIQTDKWANTRYGWTKCDRQTDIPKFII